MSHIEDEYKDRFKNEQLPNDDFDMEGLWDDISGDLDQDASSKRRVRFPWFLIFIIGLTIFGLGIFSEYVWDNSSTTNLSENENKKEMSTPVSSNLKSYNNTTLVPNHLIEDQSSTNLSSSEKVSTNSFNENKSLIQEKRNYSSNKLTEQILIQNSEERENEQNKNLDTSNTIEQPIVKKQNTIPAFSKTHLQVVTIPNRASLLDYTQKENLLFKNPMYYFSTIESNENEGENHLNSLKWKVGLFAGSNVSNFNFNSKAYASSILVKEQNIESQFGYTFGVNTALVFKDNWVISSGLEYQQLSSKFDFEQTQNIEVPKENQLLRVWIDANTNDTINTLYGTDTLTGTNTRKVVHYNQYSFLNIPIELGFQNNRGKFLYGLSAGITLNFSLQQSGRTLDKDDMITYFDNNSSAAHFSKFGLGYRVNPIVGYQLSKKWNLMLRPQINWQVNSIFNDNEDFKIKTRQLNFNIGVEYNFN